MNKTIKISVQNLNKINALCNEIGIDATQYEMIENDLAGKLMFDLCRIKLFHVGDIKAGRMSAPDPCDYMRGGKYDRNKG